MEVTTALRKVKRQFGDEYDVTIVDEDIFYWFHEAELDIIRQTASNDVVVNLAVSTFPAVLPHNVIVKRVAINDKAITYTTKAELDLQGSTLSREGTPLYWYWEGGAVYLYPIGQTGDSFNVQVIYCKVPEEMTVGAPTNEFTVPEVFHEDVVKYAIGRAHNKNMNWKAAEAEMEVYDRNVSARRNEAQSIDAPLYKGADPEDFAIYYEWTY